MNLNPIVSIIIPVYNAELYLDQCINSLINQSLKNIEIICVDDGSNDHSLTILQKYQRRDDRVKVLTQVRSGAGSARNLGMSVACGKYLAFIDADDFVEGQYLEELLNSSDKYDADVCLCAADIYDNNSGIFEKADWFLDTTRIKNKPFSLNDLGNEIFKLTKFNPWAKLFKARFIRDNNLKFQELMSSNDLYFALMSICLAKRISVAEKVLFHYRRGQSTNIQSNLEKCEDNFCKALVLCRDTLERKGIYGQINIGFSDLVYQHCLYNFAKLREKPDAENRLLWKIKNEYLEMFRIEDDYSKKIMDLIFKTEQKLTQRNYRLDPSLTSPVVSVVIPVFNVEKYLNKCMDSVINQTLRNIEIICVNDGSEDGCGRILKKYGELDKRVKVVNKNKNEGLLCARRDGVLASRGEYIMFVDSDDYLDVNACEVAYKLIKEKESDILQFTCGVVDFSDDKQAVKWLKNALKPKGFRFQGDEILDAFFVKRVELTSLVGKLFKKEVLLQAYSKLDFYNCYVGEDVYQFFYFAFFAKTYCGIQTKELYFYQRGLGVSNSGYVPLSKFERYCQMSKICDNAKELILAYPNKHLTCMASVDGVSRRLLTDCLRIYSNRLSEADKPEGMHHIIRAWAHNPVFGEIVQTELGQTESDLRKMYLATSRITHLSGAFNNNIIPKVSVIIPVFNSQHFLRECLQSVLNQNEKQIEIICIDNGSTDGSLALLAEYQKSDDRISVISIDHHMESYVKNLGLKYAKGRYIRFLNVESEIGPGSIDRLCDFADENQLDVLSFGCNTFQNGTNISLDNITGFNRIGRNFSKVRTGWRLFVDLNENGEYFPDSALLLLRRGFLLEHNFSLSNEVLSSDEIFYLKCLLKANRAARLNEIHCIKNIKASSSNPKKVFNDLYSNLRSYMELLAFINDVKFEEPKIESSVITILEDSANKVLAIFNQLSEVEKRKLASLTPLEFCCFNKIKIENKYKFKMSSNFTEAKEQAYRHKTNKVIPDLSWMVSRTLSSLKNDGFLCTFRKIKNYFFDVL